MVLKYLIQGYPMPTLYFGIANVVANGLVMLRFVSLDFGLGVWYANIRQYYRAVGFSEYRG